MDKKNLDQQSLAYHQKAPTGKIALQSTKPLQTQNDLSLAYSPGVAAPCKAIAENKEKVYDYTAKKNLVGVISNGTAVLGLGNIGPEASKPVMEGKAVLFKKFAGIDAFDLELDANDPDLFVQTVQALSPTFGGINLEDIKAPECFYIEEQLKKKLSIPIMHDDQHGTAIISGAALLNALDIAEKNIRTIKVVINGAGASAIACAKLYLALGVQRKNMIMCDSKGVIQNNRKDLTATKQQFATDKHYRTLDEAIKNADLFLGLSKGNILKPAHLQKMNINPIIFALANPDPEINYDLALSTRKDVIMATGRSDYPNQVNNVLGFPYIFRGALDVRATTINEAMKLAAVDALAQLAKAPVLDEVKSIYQDANLTFGRNYFIPKPIDKRLITTISIAVAKAAMDTHVAQKSITDWQAYEEELKMYWK